MIGLQELAATQRDSAPAQGLSGANDETPHAIWHSGAGLSGAIEAPQQSAARQTEQAGPPAESDKAGGRIQQAIALLQSPLGQHFDDPDFRQAAERYDSFLNKGEKPEGVTKEGLYDFGNKLFARELQNGVGSKLPDGSTITGKRLVAARPVGDHLVLELDITAKKPDGTSFNYQAPVTKNRTHEDTDEVLHIPIEKVRDRVRGAVFMARAVEQAGGRDAVLQQLMQQAGQQDGAPGAPQPQAGGLQIPQQENM